MRILTIIALAAISFGFAACHPKPAPQPPTGGGKTVVGHHHHGHGYRK